MVSVALKFWVGTSPLVSEHDAPVAVEEFKQGFLDEGTLGHGVDAHERPYLRGRDFHNCTERRAREESWVRKKRARWPN